MTLTNLGMTQLPSDDEFIYESEQTGKEAMIQAVKHPGSPTSKSFNLSTGRVWTCDDSGGCPAGTVLIPNPDAYFKKNSVGGTKLFVCHTAGGREWVPVTSVSTCDKNTLQTQFTQVNAERMAHDPDNKIYYKHKSRDEFCYTETKSTNPPPEQGNPPVKRENPTPPPTPENPGQPGDDNARYDSLINKTQTVITSLKKQCPDQAK